MKPIIRFFFLILAFSSLLAVALTAQAVIPPPDGGYPGFNTAEGTKALFSLTTGSANTAVGWFSLFSNADGSFNTATGAGSLLFNTGDNNTAFGAAALLFNTTGFQNTAVGVGALLNNTGGPVDIANGGFASFNTAVGGSALGSNTIGSINTAVGGDALFSNTEGNGNTAIGNRALFHNTHGGDNTANGRNALLNNTEGASNTGNGVNALLNNDMGNANVAIGDSALASNTIGGNNTAIGSHALSANITGGGNVVVGASAGGDINGAEEVICIGAGVSGANVDHSCFIGNIFGQPVDPATATAVSVDLHGKLGTMLSSRRFKHDIKPMNKSSETILALKPVTFHYRSDAKGTPQFGLIAEEVAEVNPDLIVRDKNGEILSVRYDQVNAMLLNEFLKEHRKVEEQSHKLQKQEAALAELRKEMETRFREQDSKIQRVSDQIEMSRPGTQVVRIP